MNQQDEIQTLAETLIYELPKAFALSQNERTRPDRLSLAFLYQIAPQMLSDKQIFNLTPRITFGEIVIGNNHMHRVAKSNRPRVVRLKNPWHGHKYET
jgi:hypothetical protein